MTKSILYFTAIILLSLRCGHGHADTNGALDPGENLNWSLNYQVFGLSQQETEAVTHLTNGLQKFMPHWSWMNAIEGQQRIVITKLEKVGGDFPGDIESAPVPDQTGAVVLLVFWDNLLKASAAPLVKLIEHSASHLYLLRHLGRHPDVEPRVLEQLQAEALYSVLSDMRRPDVVIQFSPEERAVIEADWVKARAQMPESLNPEYLQHLNCAGLLASAQSSRAN